MVEFRRIGKTEDNKYVMSARPATWSAIGIKHYQALSIGSDLDPDPVESACILVRGSGSRGVK